MRTLLIIMFCACLCGCGRARLSLEFVPGSDAMTQSVVLDEPGAGGDIALIDVSGLLADTRRSGLFSDGENPIDRFAESLNRASRDPRIRGVVVRINSPGGTVTASDIMYRELRRFRTDTTKPVIILMGDVAASGGYYLACAGDEVIAHPTTITGSVGVIMQTINVSEGMRMIGIRADAITSGPNKAIGSPLEPMRPEQREILQGLVNDFYSGFRAIVLAARPTLSQLDDPATRTLLDGRIFTGTQALEHGLVDSTGDLHTAFARAKERSGLKSARLVKYHRPGGHVASAWATSSTSDSGQHPASTQINLLQLNVPEAPWLDSIGFWYLWVP